MAVIIEGWDKLPFNCYDCNLRNYQDCNLTGNRIDDCMLKGTRPSDCPLKSADVQPVVHGEWKKIALALYICSECGNEICSSEYGLSKQYKYCSQCGAKMDKEN